MHVELDCLIATVRKQAAFLMELCLYVYVCFIFFSVPHSILDPKPENEGWILFVLLRISVSRPIQTTNSKGFLDWVKDDTGRRASR